MVDHLGLENLSYNQITNEVSSVFLTSKQYKSENGARGITGGV